MPIIEVNCPNCEKGVKVNSERSNGNICGACRWLIKVLFSNGKKGKIKKILAFPPNKKGCG